MSSSHINPHILVRDAVRKSTHNVFNDDTVNDITNHLVEELGLVVEVTKPRGMDHLSPPDIFRYVTDWRAVETKQR